MALLSTVIFFTLLAVAITHAPGWPEVKRTFFNWDEFKASMPEISRAFLLNVKMFCIAEVFILVLALLLAVFAACRARCFSRCARSASPTQTSFRGVPTILVIALLGFGAPALQLSWVPLSTTFWGIVALVLVYTAYVSEVYRAGIESVHRSQDAAARSLGLTHWQSLSRVVLPQAVRRVIPPLLNDFIGLQKDTALVGFLGSIEAFKQSQIDAAATFNYTPFVAAAVLFVALTIPLARFTDWLVLRDRRRRQAAGSMMSEALVVDGVHKSFGAARGAARSGSCRRGARGRLPDRRLRLREVDASALRQPARADRRGRIVVEGEEITARGVNVNKVRRRIGIVFQAYNLFPHMSVLSNVTLAPDARAQHAARAGRGRGDRPAGPLRARRQAQRLSGSTIGRSAAAGRDRAGAWR